MPSNKQKQDKKRHMNPFSDNSTIKIQSPKLWKQFQFSNNEMEEDSSRRLGRGTVSVEMSPLIASTQSADNTT